VTGGETGPMQRALDDERRGMAPCDPVGVDDGFAWCDFPGLRPGLTNMTPSGSKNREVKWASILFPMRTSEGGQFSLAVFDSNWPPSRKKAWSTLVFYINCFRCKRAKAAAFRWQSSTQLAAFEEKCVGDVGFR